MADRRPTAAQRGYDYRWQSVTRPKQLAREPWCELCLERGVLTPANTVDHRRQRRRFPLHLQHSDEVGGADHPSNLRSLCGSKGTTATKCHNRRADDKGRGA